MGKVTAKELADMMSGCGMGGVPTEEHERLAKESGLLIFYGHSDDLMEVCGAWEEEFGCYEGGEILFNANEPLEIPDNCDCEDFRQCPLLEEHAKKNFRNKIEAVWCDEDGDEDGPAWTYKTDIPHETFDIMEDGEVWCRGVVIDTEDLK
jgi:hypothetical protein